MHWYQKLPGRLLKEQEIVKSSFPQSRLIRVGDGDLAWILWLRTNSNREYLVEIVYPDGFPLAYPSAFVLKPRIKRAPHQYNDGHLCLFSTVDRPERSYVPSKTTAATVIAWTAAWLASYEIWQRTGTWPEKRRR